MAPKKCLCGHKCICDESIKRTDGPLGTGIVFASKHNSLIEKTTAVDAPEKTNSIGNANKPAQTRVLPTISKCDALSTIGNTKYSQLHKSGGLSTSENSCSHLHKSSGLSTSENSCSHLHKDLHPPVAAGGVKTPHLRAYIWCLLIVAVVVIAFLTLVEFGFAHVALIISHFCCPSLSVSANHLDFTA